MESARFTVRGGRVVGKPNVSLTPDVLAELGAALGTVLGEGAIVVTARDYYPPSRMLKRAFSAGLMSTGITVIDFHGATTPELAFAIKRFGAKCGVQFTTSPYGPDSTNVKFLDATTAEFTAEKVKAVIDKYERGHIVRSLTHRIGWVSYAEYIHDIYVASLLGIIDANSIASCSPCIVVDHNFGPSDEVIPELYSSLGADVVSLNAHRPPSGRGARHLPSLKSLSMVSKISKSAGADMGVAFCSDATRLIVFDENGRMIDSGDLSAIMVSMLPEGSTVIASLYASKKLEKVAEKRGVRVVRVKSRPCEIARYIRRYRATMGDTGRGEYIFPSLSLSPDAILASIKILEYMSQRGVKLSQLASEIPRVNVYKERVKVEPEIVQEVCDRFAEVMPTAEAVVEGVKVLVDDETVIHIKPDPDTGEILIVAEEVEREKRELVKEVKERLEQVVETTIVRI